MTIIFGEWGVGKVETDRLAEIFRMPLQTCLFKCPQYRNYSNEILSPRKSEVSDA